MRVDGPAIMVMSLGAAAGNTVGSSRGTAILRYREIFEDVAVWVRSQGAFEAWQVDGDGYVTEGGSTNAWIINGDGH